jgi:hypothetical protein
VLIIMLTKKTSHNNHSYNNVTVLSHNRFRSFKLVVCLIAEKSLNLKNLPKITDDNLSLDVRSEAIVHQGSPEHLLFLHVLYKGDVGHCFSHFNFMLYMF